MSAFKVFNQLYKLKNIKAYYEEKNKLKPSTGIDGVNDASFKKNIDLYSDIIHRKVNNNTYSFIPYKEKLINKGKDKYPRIISIPTLRDKLTMSILHSLLSEVYSQEIKNEIVQTVIANIKASLNNTNYNYFIKIDIEKFYDNISHELLLKKLRKKSEKKK
ncbi:reverse transcriptase domain-containing protein [Metabacillus indicus]|uniref:reverse transcriptase domain-containing protein n=1 Tax=Metabacillus indicus TaxID=246786 RepID=UPI0039840A43